MCALWIDKHRPKVLDELTVHETVTNLLKSISKSMNFPHLLFTGSPGSGKKTRVMAFLRAVFNAPIENLRGEYVSIDAGSKTIEAHVINSPFHIELTPADSGNSDRLVITHFVKAAASSQNVQKDIPKIIVLNDAHRLSKLAQQALRRLMEKYAKSCRFILIANSLSQILEPIRSRCFVIRTPKISDDDLLPVLESVGAKENLKFPADIYGLIVQKAEGDMRRAIVSMELLSLQSRVGIGSVAKSVPEWERYMEDLCTTITTDQHSVDTMKRIRGSLYELLVHCIPPSEIFQKLLIGLIKRVDSVLIPTICEAASTFESRMNQGTKPIFHLEAFVARFICIFQDYMNN